MKKILPAVAAVAMALSLHIGQAIGATVITLFPASTTAVVGSPLNLGVWADIDSSDEIIAYGFDLSLTGDGALIFNGFTPGGAFADDQSLALLSDTDGIRGASGGDLVFGPAVSGSAVLLGTLMFTASGPGSVAVSLGGDDLAGSFTEGLIPADASRSNFLPPISGASITVVPVPVPGALPLFVSGVAALALWKNRQAFAGTG